MRYHSALTYRPVDLSWFVRWTEPETHEHVVTGPFTWHNARHLSDQITRFGGLRVEVVTAHI